MSKDPVKSQKTITANYWPWLALLLILFVTYFSYYPATSARLTNWDDNKYVTDNPVIKDFSKDNVKKMLSDNFEGNYHPLTMLSLAYNYSQGKLEPGTYHNTNILLHLLNTALVFWLIFLLAKDIPVSIIVAALFGIHTMHAESVAWVSERKDVLYAFFFLISLITYIYYTQRKKWFLYLASVLLFILSLLSKGMAVSLAPTLILIDFYLGRKLADKKIILEKIPYFLFAFLFGIIAFKAQDINVNELANEIHYPFMQRVAFAGYGFINYIGKLIYPYHLAILYPYPVKAASLFTPIYFIFPLIALVLLVIAVYSLKFSRDYFFGTVFFILNVVLVLQIISVGIAVMADRYTYISSIGLFFMVGSIYKNINAKYKNSLIIVLLAYSGVLIYQTRERCKVWNNSISLWTDQAEKYPDYAVAYGNRGLARGFAGDHDGAMKDFTIAIEKEPTYASAFDNRGRSKEFLGDIQGAMSDYTSAIAADKTFYISYQSRAKLRISQNDFKGAIEDLNAALLLKQNDATLYFDRGTAWANLQELKKAADDFTKTISLNPSHAMAYTNRGLIKANQNDNNGALSDYNMAIQIDPKLAIAYFNRGGLRLKTGDKSNACADFQSAQMYGFANATAVIEQYCR